LNPKDSRFRSSEIAGTKAIWRNSAAWVFGTAASLDHDDFGLIQSKIMNLIDSNKLERDVQIGLRNLRKLDCAGKPVATFPYPVLGVRSIYRHDFRVI
jgi:hypothetical protein